jgi:CRISPR/Cas system CMR subunit Cmr4 (Cas7 group RAMP superfamily)
MKLTLHLKLLSDTTFGRGDGVSGLVDQEIEHDTKTGLPFIRGRTLKGLLVEECANILYAVPDADRVENAARQLFGMGGSGLQDTGLLHVGNAELQQNVVEAVRQDIKANRLRPSDVLDMFTAIRRQTAMNEETGTPDHGSLRSSRVLLRETELYAPLEIALPDDNPTKEDALALLSACVAGLRRGGIGRNRGRGRLEAQLEGINMDRYLEQFELMARSSH